MAEDHAPAPGLQLVRYWLLKSQLIGIVSTSARKVILRCGAPCASAITRLRHARTRTQHLLQVESARSRSAADNTERRASRCFAPALTREMPRHVGRGDTLRRNCDPQLNIVPSHSTVAANSHRRRSQGIFDWDEVVAVCVSNRRAVG